MGLHKLNISSNYNIVFNRKGWKPLCYINNDLLIFSKGKFLILDLNNYKSKVICSLNNNYIYNVLSKSRLFTRLLRLEPRGVINVNGYDILVPIKGKIYHLDIKSKTISEVHKFRDKMSAPLSITKIENTSGIKEMYCYGEYFSNPEKDEVRIFGCNEDLSSWHEVYRFKRGEINHIHSIITDPYKDRIWILTGDYDNSASIWYTDDGFMTVKKYLGGEQRYRVCVAFPISSGLIYATDTPLEENNIYFLSDDKELKNLYDLEGSSIYGTKVQDKYVFSTVVEGHSDDNQGKLNLLSYKRGIGIKTWYSELIIGNKEQGFNRIGRFKKDFLPMGLMQFGTITFPSGFNNNDRIILYGSALKKIDGTLLILEEKLETK